MLGWMHWNFDGELFVIPWIHHPVRLYGVIFALGILVGYWIWKTLAWRFFLIKDPFVHSKDLISVEDILKKLGNLPGFSSKIKQNLVKKKEKLAFEKWLQDGIYNPCLEQPLLKLLNTESFVRNLPVAESDSKQIVEKLSKWRISNSFAASRLTLELFLDKILKKISDQTTRIVDEVLLYIILGTVIGARLGHVLFYDIDIFLKEPWRIFKTWEGGLASHGGVAGVLLGLYLFYRKLSKDYPRISFLEFLDTFMIPTAFVSFCIRIGNFTNQEILGIPTTLPWAIVFENPFDGSLITPRHPAQLYEAAFYIFTFGFLFALWFFGKVRKPGFLTGAFFLLVFGSRFAIEFIKPEQSSLLYEGGGLVMGQWLSIPLILLGAYLVARPENNN
jgi:phosphatidylglycerol---prolipoprotein diacylglyceryl transferase